MSVWELANCRLGRRINSVADEFHQSSVWPDDAQRAIAGTGELTCCRDNPIERAPKIQIAGYRYDGVRQGSQSLTICGDPAHLVMLARH